MENLNLNAELRTKDERLNEIRNSKLIPSIVYGKKQESTLIKVDNSDFLRIFRKSGKSHIINLKID
jgi:ribosomal protein L25 (general stress protein Ctc)